MLSCFEFHLYKKDKIIKRFLKIIAFILLMITLTSCAISNKSHLNQNKKTSSSNENSYEGTTALVLKKIIIDELTREKEAVILYDSMYVVIEEEEEIAGRKIIEINSDNIVFKKDGKTETLYIE